MKGSIGTMIVFSEYTKQRILFWFNQRNNRLTISRLLLEEDIVVSLQGIQKFWKATRKVVQSHKSLGSGFCSEVSEEVKKLIDE